MDDQDTLFTSPAKREPWNKGKFTGAKPPLRPKHVWSIRSKLQADGRTRDLAMFNLTVDSKLRACDVVALKVEDVGPNGYAADRATVRQRKNVEINVSMQSRRRVALGPAAPDRSLRAAWNLGCVPFGLLRRNGLARWYAYDRGVLDAFGLDLLQRHVQSNIVFHCCSPSLQRHVRMASFLES
jgi:hypothetical protein